MKFISSRYHVMFFLLYKRADGVIFDDFPKISDHFTKISKDFPKLLRRPEERFQTFFEHFETFSEDCRRRSKKVRICFDHTPTNFNVVEGTKE